MYGFITVKSHEVSWQLEDGRSGADPRFDGPVTPNSLHHPKTVKEFGSQRMVTKAESDRRAAETTMKNLRRLGADEFDIRYDS